MQRNRTAGKLGWEKTMFDQQVFEESIEEYHRRSRSFMTYGYDCDEDHALVVLIRKAASRAITRLDDAGWPEHFFARVILPGDPESPKVEVRGLLLIYGKDWSGDVNKQDTTDESPLWLAEDGSICGRPTLIESAVDTLGKPVPFAARRDDELLRRCDGYKLLATLRALGT